LGTPGRINSVDPLTVDGQIIADSLRLNPSIVEMNSTTIITGYVTNRGRSTIFGDVEILEGDNILESIYIHNLSELDTSEFSATVGPFSSGNHELTAQFVLDNDGDESNNESSVILGVRYPDGLLTINEFLPYPFSGEPEFIELFYHGSESLLLSNWAIADMTGSPVLIREISIEMEHYFVISEDSSLVNQIPDSSLFSTPLSNFPNLNNGGDAIRIFDPYGTLIDSLIYTDNWGYGRGQSMEKIYPNYLSSDSSSWQPSLDTGGMTAGVRNSVMPWPVDGTIDFHKIIYYPIIPGNMDSIQLQIPVANIGQISFTGYIYIEFEEEELASRSISIQSPGDTVFIPVTIGPLPSGENSIRIALDVLNDGNPFNNADSLKIKIRFPFGTIKINEFMARPNNDQIEFIEAVCFYDLPLFTLSFSDHNQQQKYIPALNLKKGDYIVLAIDSSLFPLENENTHFVVPYNGWPSLNNSGDAIYLYDLTESIIDSLYYTNNWNITDEISTEKLRPEFESFNQSNWMLSTDGNGSTPGYANSVTLFDLDGGIIFGSVEHEPLYPKKVQTIISTLKIANVGVIPFSGSIRLIIDGDDYGSSAFETIDLRDTVSHAMEFGPLISGYHRVEFQLSVDGDENSTNNIVSDSVLVSYDFGVVVLNEFLAIPDTNQSEFIELAVQDPVLMQGLVHRGYSHHDAKLFQLWQVSDRKLPCDCC